jgi:WD40 repeat protein
MDPFDPSPRRLGRLGFRALRLTLVAALAVCGLGARAARADDAKVRQEVRKLIGQLDDDSPRARDAATQRLKEIGEPALPLLREAAEKGAGVETRIRARAVIRTIEQAFFGEAARWEGHPTHVGLPWVTRLAVTPDGSRVVTAGADGLRAWDVKAGKTVRQFGEARQAGVWSLAVSGDGRHLISGGNDQVAHVWELKSGKELKRLTGHTGPVWGAALSADGRRAVTGAWDKTLRLWDVDAGKELRRFDGVAENVRCLALSPDGKLVAAGHFDDQQHGVIRLWGVADGKEVRALEGHKAEVTSVAYSADGKRLLSSSFDSTVRVWDVATGEERKVLAGHTGRIEGAAFTPDGKRAVSVGDQGDPTVRVWDLASGKALFCSDGTPGGFLGVAVLPGSRQVVTAGKDGMVRLWRMTR